MNWSSTVLPAAPARRRGAAPGPEPLRPVQVPPPHMSDRRRGLPCQPSVIVRAAAPADERPGLILLSQ